MMDRRGDPEEVIRRGIAVATAPGWAEAHPESVEELVRYRLTTPVPPAAYSAQVAAGAAHDASARVAQILAPVLVIAGDSDRVVPPGNADLLAKKLPHATLEILPGAGHMLPIEAPEALASAVLRFLAANR
jgi:pimeloyl-ACP methyl ester carboxylesterase